MRLFESGTFPSEVTIWKVNTMVLVFVWVSQKVYVLKVWSLKLHDNGTYWGGTLNPVMVFRR